MSLDVNPYDAPQERSQNSHHQPQAVGPLLLLGMICFFVQVFIQVFDVPNLASNSVTNVGLVLVGFGSVGYSFFLFRSHRKRNASRNLARRS